MRVFAAALLLWGATSPAHAYIDPGSGLLLLQGVLAVVGGIIVFVRHPIQTIKRWIGQLRKREDA